MPEPRPPAVLTEPDRSDDALPKCASRADVERLHGQKVRVEALYDVDPVPGGKRLEAAYLLLDDGTELVRSYRPVPDELGLVEKRVVAVGTVYRDANRAQDIQQLLAPHFYPERIELAVGEARVGAAPTERPLPTRVERVADLAGRYGRWVRITGKLTKLNASPDRGLSGGILSLANGDNVAIPHVNHTDWQEFVGSEVTVVGKVIATGERAGEAAAIAERAHCKGHVERCSR